MQKKESELLSKIETEIMRRHQNHQFSSTLNPSWSGRMQEMFVNGPF